MKKVLTFLFVLLIAIAGVLLIKEKNIILEQKNTTGFLEATAPNTDDKLKEKIGQMIIVGFRGTEVNENSEIAKIINEIKPGGVVLFDYDVPSKSFPRNITSPSQTKKLVENLQSFSTTPLFMATDAEGGNVLRLKPKYGFEPILSAQKMGDGGTQTTDKESKKLAEELNQAGFNLNFAPVVDVNTNPQNPIIGKLERSFSGNPQAVFENAEVFIKNMSDKNIISVAKHFPGHGSSTTDSHLGLVDITNTYDNKESEPYKNLFNSGSLDAVMTAHIINKNIDPKYPATLSEIFLQNILRSGLGFKGVIISDDMQMGAISENYGLEEAVVSAVNAGCNILITSNNTNAGYDGKVAYKIRDILFNAVKNKNIALEKIEQSYSLILALKQKFGITK